MRERIAQRLERLRPTLWRGLSALSHQVLGGPRFTYRDGRLWTGIGGPRFFLSPDGIHVDATAVIADALVNTSSGTVTVQGHAFFGHEVALLTGTHDIAQQGEARQRAVPAAGRDIVVEDGAWIGSRAMVLGPARIGAHAVVAAGAVVTGDVAPYTIVGGVPARPLGRVPGAPSL